MTPPPLIDAAGKPLPLGTRLGGGGEGDVYESPGDSTQVVKVYRRPPDTLAVEKLTAMAALATDALRKVAAWPTGLVRDARTRQVAGFVMPRVADSHSIQSLYNPAQRLRSFPRAGWAFQVRAALNLAAAFDGVHEAGCLVADVNQSNALVSPTALVRLIDCDSFQVRAGGKSYLCDVGVPHYTPPELQGKPLRGVTRTANHDRFGLAVLIYQLLFVGRHPYAGLYSGPDDPSFDKLIADYRFAQGPDAHTWQMAPPPHVPTLADLPPALGTLFRRAFERATSGDRPTASDWHAALQKLDGDLATCPADAGHTFWRGAGPCVWCRLAERGPEYYFGVAGGIGTFAVDEPALQAALKRLEAARGEEFPYRREDYTPPVPPSGKALPAEFAQLKSQWRVARESITTVVSERSLAEAKEKHHAIEQQNLTYKQLERRFALMDAELEAEYDSERGAADAERRGRQVVAGVLMTATLSGVFLVPLGLIHKGFSIFGTLLVVVFGIWLSIYVILFPFTTSRHRAATLHEKRQRLRSRMDEIVQKTKSEADDAVRAAERLSLMVRQRQELAAREAEQAYLSKVETELAARSRAESHAEGVLTSMERERSRQVAAYREVRSETQGLISSGIARCRGLAAEFQRELAKLTANAESAGRLRHLRLHPVADATIPKVGAGRKQALADAGVLTAADVSADAVLRVPGFGQALTANVVAWRDGVLQTFRFDPAAAVTPSEQAATVLKFRGQQQQLLNELAGHLAALEALAPAARAGFLTLQNSLRQAFARYEQARADLRLMSARP